MVDHIVIRRGGTRGQVKNVSREFAQISPPFRHVQAMCNAIKHVNATGGGSATPITTTTGTVVAYTDKVLFKYTATGQAKELRTNCEVLVLNVHEDHRDRKILVGSLLYCALFSVAKHINCETLVENLETLSNQPETRRRCLIADTERTHDINQSPTFMATGHYKSIAGIWS